jgi:hypothetical protein
VDQLLYYFVREEEVEHIDRNGDVFREQYGRRTVLYVDRRWNRGYVVDDERREAWYGPYEFGRHRAYDEVVGTTARWLEREEREDREAVASYPYKLEGSTNRTVHALVTS